MRKIPLFLTVLGALLLVATGAQAVVSTSAATLSTSPTTAGWDYVGSVNDASGVYLGDFSGNYFVLTAGHVGAGSFTLGGYTYSYVASSSFQITNSDSSSADLVLYEITSEDGAALAYLDTLSNLTISSRDLSANTAVTMIGNGGGKSSGTNIISGKLSYTVNDSAFGGTGYVLLDSNGVGATGGDSGGGLFSQDIHGNLVLSGILSAIGDFTTSGGTNLGHGTIAVDLAVYYSQITSVITAAAIPEPATWAVLIGTTVFGLALFRRSRSRGGHC